VIAVHELHIWRLNQYKTIASAHIVTSDRSLDAFTNRLRTIRECFHAYDIHSVTLQPEESGDLTLEESDAQSIRHGERPGCKVKCGDHCVELFCCTN
jgi:solute carrier family 30 (zinc transporter), member 1